MFAGFEALRLGRESVGSLDRLPFQFTFTIAFPNSFSFAHIQLHSHIYISPLHSFFPFFYFYLMFSYISLQFMQFFPPSCLPGGSDLDISMMIKLWVEGLVGLGNKINKMERKS
jgi:hypothetical protein